MIDKKTYANEIRDMLPESVRNNPNLAEDLVDIMFGVPLRALQNGDQAELPGLGIIKLDRSKGDNCVSFEPSEAIIQCATQLSSERSKPQWQGQSKGLYEQQQKSQGKPSRPSR